MFALLVSAKLYKDTSDYVRVSLRITKSVLKLTSAFFVFNCYVLRMFKQCHLSYKQRIVPVRPLRVHAVSHEI